MTIAKQPSSERLAVSVLLGRNVVETFRTPDQYVAWFNTLLEWTRDLPDELHRKALLHEGPFKQFYEEIFPLAMLLKHKLNDWKDSRFRNLCDANTFDVEVKSETLPFEWMEITCSNFDADQYFRMQQLARIGSVDLTGKICRDDHGRPVGISEDMREADTAAQELRNKIQQRIENKCDRNYVPNPALIVYFDDYTSYLERNDYSKIENTCHSCDWQEKFSRLYVVGPRNERLIELKE